MSAGRIVEIDGVRHLLLSSCPHCSKGHDSVVETAEHKFSDHHRLFPFYSICPGTGRAMLLRFESDGVHLHPYEPPLP